MKKHDKYKRREINIHHLELYICIFCLENCIVPVENYGNPFIYNLLISYKNYKKKQVEREK